MHVEQTPEFPSDFPQRADMDEAETRMEVDTFVAALGNEGDEGVVAEAGGFGDDGFLEPAADPLAAVRGAHEEGALGSVVVGGAVGPARQRGPADDAALGAGDQHGMALVVRAEPGGALLHALRLGIEGRRGVQDRLIVDLGDGGGIAVCGWTNDHRGSGFRAGGGYPEKAGVVMQPWPVLPARDWETVIAAGGFAAASCPC